MNYVRQLIDWFKKPRNRTINALEFEQKLLTCEDLIDTSENLAQCDQSLRNLNKLHRTLRPKDRQIFINRLNILQAKFDSKISFVESLSRSHSNINIEHNDEMDKRRYGSSRSRKNKNQQPYQRPSPKSIHASYSSTVIDMETADVPTNCAVSKNNKDYNQKTGPIFDASKKLPVNKQQQFRAQSKQELNDNGERKTYNLRSKTYSSAVRTDNQQKRFPETNQDPATEQKRKQIMNSTYRAFSSRTNENEISKASEKHRNRYSFDQDPREVVQSFGQHLDEYQKQTEQNLGHSQIRGYPSGKIEQFPTLARVENENYERSKSGTVKEETSCNNFQDSDNLAQENVTRIAQQFGHEKLRPDEEELLQQNERIEEEKFGYHHEEHQRQREEEEEALRKAQREVEEKRQRQEQQHQRQLEEQRIKEKERQLQQQAEEINKTEIVDISDQFIDDSIKKHPNKNNLDYFEVIRNKAKSFEDSIEQFNGDDYMEYFILHENLMQLIEIMDRIRCEKDETLFPHKIQIIDYIKQLIENLNARNRS